MAIVDHMTVCFVGLKGNPLSPDILNIYNQANGTQLLLRYMLDHLPGNWTSDLSGNPHVALDILPHFYKLFWSWNPFFLQLSEQFFVDVTIHYSGSNYFQKVRSYYKPVRPQQFVK